MLTNHVYQKCGEIENLTYDERSKLIKKILRKTSHTRAMAQINQQKKDIGELIRERNKYKDWYTQIESQYIKVKEKLKDLKIKYAEKQLRKEFYKERCEELYYRVGCPLIEVIKSDEEG